LILGLSCHFLVQIKGNCRRLWTTMALYCAFHRPISTFEYYEEKHGNLVFRNVTLYALPNEPLLKDWEGISRVAKVRRWGYKKGKPFEETAYYALSRPINSAQIAADAIRGHWSIENDLHWTKDVIMGEDDMSYKSKNAMTVIAYLNNILLNIARAAGEKPNKDFFAKYANKVDRMMNLFYYKKTKK
jgi:predicted transposase YbfD/YdcC